MALSSSSGLTPIAKENTVLPVWTYFQLEANEHGKAISKDIAYHDTSPYHDNLKQYRITYNFSTPSSTYSP